MANQKYIDYIKQNITSYPIESLKEQLISSGASEEEIDEAVKAAQGGTFQEEEHASMFESGSTSKIEGVKKSYTLTKKAGYSQLVFTDKRVISAHLASTFWWSFMLGVIGGLIAMGIVNKKAKQLETLTPESILKSDNNNFDISYESLSIEMKKPKFLSMGKITLISGNKKEVYAFQKKETYTESLTFLKQLLPNKVTEK